jgi:tetratricopeptide (TPR) repeat protein
VEKLGEGGMGEVWVAKQTEPVKRKVAVKVIKAGMDSRAVLARFEAERQALAMMDHPNIARVLDGGLTPDGRPFFVMELVNGLPLTRFCDEAKLTPRERLALFVPVCQAVQHAHQKGIVHRDLKPANILVTLIDGKPVPRVIDFGVAKATAGKLTDASLSTQFGAVVGTLEYMAPEQAGYAGEDVDTRADIYSLGVILYELLTGLRPFEGKRLRQAALAEAVRILREEEPSRPSTRLSTAESLPSLAALRQTEPKKLMALLRGELDWVVMKCLEKQRERRYETANGLARDLQRYLADEPVEARPPSVRYRLGKFLRRNKGPVVAAGLVLLALVGGIIGTTLGMLRAEEALGRETEQRTKAEQARDRTRQALDAMTSSVTGESLTTQKALSAEQKQFLTEVLAYYQEFAGEQADDELSRFRTAKAAHRVGTIEYRLGRKAEAAAAFRQALQIREQLAADFPGVPSYRQDLAKSHNNLGNLLAGLGKRPEAEQQYLLALALQEKLAADFPAVPAYGQELAASHHNLGLLLVGQGKRPEAEQQYRKALALYEKLATDFPAVPLYRQRLASSHTNLGALLAGPGKRAEAEREYRQALALQERLAADFPAVPEYRQDLARSHYNLGTLLRDLGEPGAARQAYQQALTLLEKLATDFPGAPQYRQDLANSHRNLGLLLAGLGRGAAAEQQYRLALALREQLATDFPAVPEYRQELANSHNNLGVLLADLGKGPEAEQQYRLALALREQLAAESPAVPAYQVEVGGSYCNFGHLIRGRGRASDSLVWYEKAIRTLTPMCEQGRQPVMAKPFLRNSHAGRAMAYDRLHQFTEALKDWDRAIELSPPQGQAGFRASRATTQVNAGQVAEAVAEVAALTKLAPWNAGQWYDFACVYALASAKSADKKQENADRAMELLRRAVQAGWKNAAHMRKDTDLDPLRGREDFQKLIRELEKHPAAGPG